MTPAEDKIWMPVKPLNLREQAEAQIYFTRLLAEMKRHVIPDEKVLKKAYALALTAYGGRRKETEELCIVHSLRVAKILADCGHETDVVSAAMLHEVLEVRGVTKGKLEEELGLNIADIVDAVTSIDAKPAPDESISEFDLDIMEDVRFLKGGVRSGKAVYIKCADRIDDLRTISSFPEEKQRAEAYYTRNMLIPAARKLRIHYFADILGDLCLQIENPERYRELKDTYKDVLRKNKDTFSRPDGLIKGSLLMVREDDLMGKYVKDFDFKERCIDSIHLELSGKLGARDAVKVAFKKHMVPLFDVYFISGDLYTGSPDDLFFAFYDRLHESPYQLTIVGHHQDDYETYYIMKDRYGNNYRLFVQSETEHLEFTQGLLFSSAYSEFHNSLDYVDAAESGGADQKMISVFTKDGSMMSIVDGATVLDFAFALDSNVGLCAKYAYLNGGTSRMPIYTRLSSGDMVEIVADYSRQEHGSSIPHATVRWFEYLHSREATKVLSRWLEKHMDAALPPMLVYDATGAEYEIDLASTVLDFAFVVGDQVGLHVKKAYINNSPTPAELDTTLRYGDQVRFEYDPEDSETPALNWMSIVKTKRAKDKIIDYFSRKLTNDI